MHQTTLVLSLLLAVTATASASGLSGGRREPSAWQALSGSQPLPRAPVFNKNVNWPNGHSNSQEKPTYDPSVIFAHQYKQLNQRWSEHDSAFVQNYFTRLAISKLLSVMEFIYLITDS